MERQPLREQLERLDAEIRRAQSLDEQEREALDRLAGDIREALAREGEHTQPYEGLGDRLKDAVAQLESSHPAATMLMRQLIDQLSFMGI